MCLLVRGQFFLSDFDFGRVCVDAPDKSVKAHSYRHPFELCSSSFLVIRQRIEIGEFWLVVNALCHSQEKTNGKLYLFQYF